MAYDGPEIYRAPFGNDAAFENFQRTMLDGVAADEITGLTDRELDSDRVCLWGTKESVEGSWKHVEPGDFLIFYRDGQYEYGAEVLATEKNEALGKHAWPNYEEGSPWTCIIYLDDPVELGVASTDVHDLAGYDVDHTMGFSPLNEMGIGGIRGKYGSVEEFVYGNATTGGDGSEKAVDVTAQPTIDIPESVLDGLYYPPNHGTGTAALVEKIEDALNAGKHVIFTGPPGTGKTEIARRVCEYLAERHPEVFSDYEMTTATADWSTFETVGGYMPGEDGGGNLDFEPGQVLRCFKEGGRQRNDLLVIDEINRSDIDKSFGQLFTLLSGQGIQLPFTRDGEGIEVLPASETDGRAREPHEYVVPDSWRIFATMNSYDKTSLYEMSYAFMRRFAFIYVDAPTIPDDRGRQRELVERYAETWGIEADPTLCERVGAIWFQMNAGVDERRIGPAIVKDLLAHCAESNGDPEAVLTEAVMSYVFPQLEGVRRREQVVSALASLDHLNETRMRSVAADILQIRFDE